MKRRLIAFTSVASLLLCAASVVVWVQSYYLSAPSPIVLGPESGWVMLLALDGQVQVSGGHGSFVSWVFPVPNGFPQPTLAQGCDTHWGSFGITIHKNAYGFGRRVVLPIGLLTALTAVLPTAGLLRRLRRGTKTPVCPRCYYNLTGNTSGTCPECGTAIPTPTNKESPRPA